MSIIRHPLFLFCLVFVAPVQAEWVEVTGHAPVLEGQYEQARHAARDDALQQALMQAGVKISSQQQMRNGVLVKDELKVQSQARVNRSRIINEYVFRDELYMTLQVDIETMPSCPASQSSQYRKKVAVLGFAIQTPEQARTGDLHNVDRGMASALNQALHRQGGLIVHENSRHKLYQETINAPSGFTSENTLSKAVDMAKQMGAQFVISGVVRDLGLEDVETYGNSYWQRFLNLGGEGDYGRRFSVDIFVHDGFSGAIVWQRNFSLTADWNAEADKAIGFGTPAFWALDYGKAVADEIETIAYLIEEQLRCQPFMTRVTRVEGKKLHFMSGASSGIRPGDKLALYRTFKFTGADQISHTEYNNAKVALTVSQVHPGFATGTVPLDLGRVGVQEDDLLIAW